ncbi:ABC transporter substrate-binding protein [Sphingomonas sp. NFR15]|uniref:ABC transporter substrate-binding protein n=1 Tax=Sphingomonas sp. NFR15 TaxID=1566282 RepID=UPI00088175EC|nr:ABC transporter substrate-binding protein [Sphingomonas sp. NFR15]SDA36858.1 sulfonate transport system substrate-binding protein [Sphingomonas sp. NFR15]
MASSRKLWTAGAVALLVIALAAILWPPRPHGAAPADALVLKVGDQKGNAQALLQAAGELNHVPYRIEFALFPAASPLLQALGANAIDIGGVGGAPFAFAYASGQPIKAVYAYQVDAEKAGSASAIIVRAGSPLRGIADLKGRKIATVRGSAGQDLALRLIERAGLSAKDVQWVYLDNGQAKAALASGVIDAWSTWGSYVGIATLEDHDRVLADGRGITPGTGFYAASDTAITGKRAQIADFLTRLERARRWTHSHQRDYAEALAKDTGISVPVALVALEANLGHGVPITPALVAEQRAIFERYRAAGIIPSVPEVSGGYDASFAGVPTHK